jgi:hypothetical protein
MVVVLEASFPSSLLCLVHGGCAGGVLPLLRTLLGAGEEEDVVVVLEASSHSSSLCLVWVRRRACWLCWRRSAPPPHSAWCG